MKLLGLKISNNKGKIIDTVFSLIDVVEYLSVAKLLVFVNLKLYLSDDELKEIYKYAMYKKVNIQARKKNRLKMKKYCILIVIMTK